MQYNFYNCEFSVENDAFIHEGGFERYRGAVRVCMEQFNNHYSETRAAGVMPYLYNSSRLAFIMKISPEIEDKSSMLNRFKDILYEKLSSDTSLEDKPSVLKSQDSIHTRLFKLTDAAFLSTALNTVQVQEELEDVAETFMTDVEAETSEDDLIFEDDELSNDEFSGVFDFSFGNVEEEVILL